MNTTAIFGFIGVIIGAMTSPLIDLFRESRKIKRDVSEKRYLAFYLPFLKICAKLSIDYSEQYVNQVVQKEIYQLLLENLEYLDKRTVKYFPEFCYALTDLNDPAANTQSSYAAWEKSFQDIAHSVIMESKRLSKILKLEDITSIARVDWRQ